MTEELEKLFDNDLTPPTPKDAIFIDGVNVAECENLDPKNNYSCDEIWGSCSGFDCNYKKLMLSNGKIKAIKEETEKLVSTIWVMSGEITDLRNENERLHNELVEAKGEQLGTLIRYNKILEGIKEVADKYSDSIDKSNDALYWIIDKINEVLK